MADQVSNIIINVKEQGADQVTRKISALGTAATSAQKNLNVTALIKEHGYDAAMAKIKAIDTIAKAKHQADVTIKTHGAETAQTAIRNVARAAKDAETGGVRGLTNGIGNLSSALSALPGPLGNVASSVSGLASRFGILAGLGGIGAVVAAAAAAVVGLGALSIKMALAADDAAEMAQKMGMTTHELLAMKLIADENSGSVEGMRSAWDRYAKTMTKADDENAKTLQSLADIGLSFDDLAGKSKEQGVATIIQRVIDLGETSTATAAAAQLLGGSWREQSVALLAAASDSAEARARTVELAGAMKVLEKTGGDAEKAINELKGTVTLIAAKLAVQWGDPTVKLIQGVNNAASKAQHLLNMLGMLANHPLLRVEGAVLGAVLGDGFSTDGASKKSSRISSGKVTQPMTSGDISRMDRMAAPQVAEDQRVQAINKMAVDSQRTKFNFMKAQTHEAKLQVEIQAGKYREMHAATIKEMLLDARAQDAFEKSQKGGPKASKGPKTKSELEIRAEQDIARMARNDAAENEAQEAHRKNLREKKQLQDADDLATDRAIRSETEKTNSLRDTIKEETIRRNVLKDVTKTQEDATIAVLDSNIADKEAAVALIPVNEGNANRIRLLQAEIVELQKRKGLLVADKGQKQGEVDAKAEADSGFGGFVSGWKSAFAEYEKSAKTAAENGAMAFTAAKDTMTAAITEFVMTGKMDFKEYARSFLTMIAKMIAHQIALNTLKMIGAFSGGKQVFAKGAAFNDGNITPFANGVVGSATMFPMANGRTGMMGEAGPEAIMPLKRGPDGKLGVQSHGSSTTGGNSISFVNNITVNGEQPADQENQRQMARTITVMIEKKFDEKFAATQRPGGASNQVSLSI